MKPHLYNRNVQLMDTLQTAIDVGFTLKYNDLHTASFKLPAYDPRNEECEIYNIVDILDGDVSRGKYRIVGLPSASITEYGAFIEYSCEHVITTLMNDVINGTVTMGGSNKKTRAVIEDLLNRQTVARWQLGTCDFDLAYSYTFENTTLMDALFSVPKVFSTDYHWEYDTDTYPWTLNLVSAASETGCEIRRGKNMVDIKREIDGSKLCNRLYCHGGQDNSIGISGVNGGKAYIDDATSIAKYGIVMGQYVNSKVTNASTLLAEGQQALRSYCNPIVSYSAKAIDLWKKTGKAWDLLDEGKLVRIVDNKMGIDVISRIIEATKNDIDGDPLDIDITITNIDNRYFSLYE